MQKSDGVGITMGNARRSPRRTDGGDDGAEDVAADAGDANGAHRQDGVRNLHQGCVERGHGCRGGKVLERDCNNARNRKSSVENSQPEATRQADKKAERTPNHAARERTSSDEQPTQSQKRRRHGERKGDAHQTNGKTE